jgi:hypothetical protein
MKYKRGGTSGPIAEASYRSMNMECDVEPSSDCLREGISFNKADLRNLAVADVKECVQHCKDTESCKAFTFRGSDHQCYLKSRYGGMYPEVTPFHWSMSMECNNSKVDNMHCMREGYDFPGAHMGNLVVAHEVECVKHCRDTEGCKAITFAQKDNRCYLKSRAGGDFGPIASAGHKSMNMICDNSPVRNLDCLRNNTNFPGANLRNFLVQSKEECVSRCRDTERCKALVFKKFDSHLRCYLKDRRGGSTVPEKAEGYESMNMECKTNNVINMKCLRKGLFFSGADIGSTVVENEEACAMLCTLTEDCKSFSFKISDKRCYAKHRRGGASGPSKDIEYNSMNMECDNSPVADTLSCLRKGLNFPSPSNDLKSIVVRDEAECVSHCRDTENCVAFTFWESNHYCYLKSKRGGFDGPTVSPGYNSLNMECDNTKPTQMKCELKDERFPGHDIRSLVVPSFEECLRRCRDTEGCRAVSFRETDNMCEMKKEKFEWWRIKSHYLSVNMDC